jgi:hypothetical protein
MADKRVLMLSTSFPPDPIGRAERIGTRVKYLVRETDWEPVVVLPMGSERTRVEIGGTDVTVYRTPVDGSGDRDDPDVSNDSDSPDNADGESMGEPDGFLDALLHDPTSLRKIDRGPVAERAIRAFKTAFTPFPCPDTYAPYLPSLVRETRALLESEDIDLLYTMCYPFTFHLCGRILKSRTGVPWLAEFRDPWVTNPRIFDGEAGPINKRLERSTVGHADRVVYNYGIQVPENYFERTYPEHGEKIERIDCPGATGFDFEKLTPVDAREEPFTITYGGSFYGSRHTPEQFLEGFAAFLDDRSFETAPMVEFFGDWRPEFDAAVDRLGLGEYVETYDWVDPDAFFERIQRAHVALFIVRPYRGDEWNVPQKITDYLATETPILALCDPEWEAGRFVDQNDIGVVADPASVDDIERQLSVLYDRYTDDALETLTANQTLLDRVDSRRLAAAFGKSMDEAVAHAGRSAR